MGEDGIPRVDAGGCTGCRACVAECPQGIIMAIPRDIKGVRVLCSNKDVNRAMVANNCKAGCIKCGLCVKNCQEQCIKMTSGIPVADNDKCTSCGICVKKCPVKVIKLVMFEGVVFIKPPVWRFFYV